MAGNSVPGTHSGGTCKNRARDYRKKVFTPFTCRISLWAGIVLFIAPVVFAAETNEEWLAQSWHNEEGLPDNSVAGVAQTPDGYLWIGTPTGLARFDGLRFENVSLTEVIPSLHRGIIAMMC